MALSPGRYTRIYTRTSADTRTGWPGRRASATPAPFTYSPCCYGRHESLRGAYWHGKNGFRELERSSWVFKKRPKQAYKTPRGFKETKLKDSKYGDLNGQLAYHIATKHVTRSPRPRTAAGAGLRAMGVEFGVLGSDKTAKSSTSSAEVLEHGASFDTRHGGGLSREA